MHKQYESTVIINATLDDGQIEQVVSRISETITKGGGSIAAVNKWGRKRLAYSIGKKSNGYYVCYEFSAPSELIATLERSYQLDEMILRYLTVVLDSKAIGAKKAAVTPSTTQEIPAAPVAVREPLFNGEGV
jgi:small subunit ribosomal protein S6